MSQTASGVARKVRPKFLNLLEIRQPIPAWASIMLRVSGAALFFPFAAWLLFLLDLSLSSEQGFEQARQYLAHPLVKLGMILLVWAFSHHLFAGIRFLLLDLHKGIEANHLTHLDWGFDLGVPLMRHFVATGMLHFTKSLCRTQDEDGRRVYENILPWAGLKLTMEF